MRALQTLGALLLVAGCSTAYGQTTPLDQSRPEVVAKAYLAALGAGDLEAALRCLDPGTDGREAKRLLGDGSKAPWIDQYLTEMLLLPTSRQVRYLKDMKVFRCPAAPDLECGYAYNADVAGKRLIDIARPSATVLFYESTLGKLDAADRGESQPRPGRHDGANHLAYVDGHAQLQPPQP